MMNEIQNKVFGSEISSEYDFGAHMLGVASKFLFASVCGSFWVVVIVIFAPENGINIFPENQILQLFLGLSVVLVLAISASVGILLHWSKTHISKEMSECIAALHVFYDFNADPNGSMHTVLGKLAEEYYRADLAAKEHSKIDVAGMSRRERQAYRAQANLLSADAKNAHSRYKMLWKVIPETHKRNLSNYMDEMNNQQASGAEEPPDSSKKEVHTAA